MFLDCTWKLENLERTFTHGKNISYGGWNWCNNFSTRWKMCGVTFSHTSAAFHISSPLWFSLSLSLSLYLPPSIIQTIPFLSPILRLHTFFPLMTKTFEFLVWYPLSLGMFSLWLKSTEDCQRTWPNWNWELLFHTCTPGRTPVFKKNPSVSSRRWKKKRWKRRRKEIVPF